MYKWVSLHQKSLADSRRVVAESVVVVIAAAQSEEVRACECVCVRIYIKTCDKHFIVCVFSVVVINCMSVLIAVDLYLSPRMCWFVFTCMHWCVTVAEK